jgi:hypothetical protein
VLNKMDALFGYWSMACCWLGNGFSARPHKPQSAASGIKAGQQNDADSAERVVELTVPPPALHNKFEPTKSSPGMFLAGLVLIAKASVNRPSSTKLQLRIRRGTPSTQM